MDTAIDIEDSRGGIVDSVSELDISAGWCLSSSCMQVQSPRLRTTTTPRTSTPENSNDHTKLAFFFSLPNRHSMQQILRSQLLQPSS